MTGSAVLTTMSLRQLKSTWENLGTVDPLWAVLTNPDRRNGRWDVEEFMATGHKQVEWVTQALGNEGLSLGEDVLDFGCGVGRLSNALAEQVANVVGVDIAESMVEQASRLNQFPDSLRFVSYDGRTLPFEDDSFDSVVSLIVLQHARPAVQLGCLLELQRVVRPGGVLVLQIPSRVKAATPLDPAATQAGIEILHAPSTLAGSAGATVRARVTNLSEHIWPTGRQVKLGNHWFDGDTMLVQDDGRADLPHDVAPGATVDLDLSVTAPAEPGHHQLELDMVQEFVTWWADTGSRPARADVEIIAGTEAPVAAPALVAEFPTEPVAHAASDDDTLAGTIEMHGLHTELVRSLFEHCGSRVVAAIPDAMAGPEWESFIYLVQRGR